jgi:hypothetical protein
MSGLSERVVLEEYGIVVAAAGRGGNGITAKRRLESGP